MADESDSQSELDRSELLGNSSYGGIRRSVETSSERRGFLQKISGIFGITTATFGSTERTSALTPKEEEIGVKAVREFADEAKRERTIRTYAADVLKALQKRGHLSRATVSELPIDRLHRTIESYGEASEGTLVVATVQDGRPKIKMQVKKQLVDRELVLIIEPQVGRSRAVLRALGDEDSDRVISADEDASTQSDCICDSFNDCISDLCGFHCCCDCAKVNVRQFCSDSACDGCEVLDNSCCGDYNCEIWAN